MDRTLTPSDRAEAEAKARQDARERANDRAAAMRQDFTRCFQTAAGKRVLAWIMQRSGFGRIILSADQKSGTIDPLATTFAAMELNFYLEIRRHLPTELIQEIEDVRRIEPSGTISEPTTGATTERITSRGGAKRKPAK